jgi:hypothetical protein
MSVVVALKHRDYRLPLSAKRIESGRFEFYNLDYPFDVGPVLKIEVTAQVATGEDNHIVASIEEKLRFGTIVGLNTRCLHVMRALRGDVTPKKTASHAEDIEFVSKLQNRAERFAFRNLITTGKPVPGQALDVEVVDYAFSH